MRAAGVFPGAPQVPAEVTVATEPRSPLRPVIVLPVYGDCAFVFDST